MALNLQLLFFKLIPAAGYTYWEYFYDVGYSWLTVVAGKVDALSKQTVYISAVILFRTDDTSVRIWTVAGANTVGRILKNIHMLHVLLFYPHCRSSVFTQ